MKSLACFTAAVALELTVALFPGWARAAQASDVAFHDVNLVPMDRERVVPHQTVVVHGDTIVAVGPVETMAIPAGARRIEGHGAAYLTPGLADMHVHVSDEDDLGLYLANGVTTVLHMGGTEQRIVGHIRADIRRGDVIGPQMLFSLMVDGTDEFGVLKVRDPDAGRATVRLASDNGYDFIKVYNNVSPDTFDALVEAGRRVGLPVVGHGVRAVGLPEALFRGQVMVAHAEEFIYTAFAESHDPATVASVVDEVRRSGAYVTPTLSAFAAISAQWGRPSQVAAYLAGPQSALVSPGVRLKWRRSGYMNRTGDLGSSLAFQRGFVRDLQRAGVPLLTGTDSPEIPGQFPGSSIHDELANLLESGLTPFEALSAATRAPGDFIHLTHPDRQRFGTIRPGARADLILAGADPLQSLNTLKQPLGVMAAGRWYDRNGLDAIFAARKTREARPTPLN